MIQLCFEELIQLGSSLLEIIIHPKWYYATSFLSSIIYLYPKDEQDAVERKLIFERLAFFMLLLPFLLCSQILNAESCSNHPEAFKVASFFAHIYQKNDTLYRDKVGSDRWNTQTTLKNIYK